jgi:hypothetical protein
VFKRTYDSHKDIDRAIEKLKNLYGKYADQYSPRIFNLDGFENRYRDALKNKVNLNAFLHAEILAFEELKRRVEQKVAMKNKPEAPAEPSYGEIADRIIEQNLARVRKYSRIDFHPDAEEEATFLLGAVTDFYYSVWGSTVKLLKPLGIGGMDDFIQKLENDFSYYVVPLRGQYSRAVDDYLIVLSRKQPKDNEKAAVNFIKYGGILLNNCRKLFVDGLNFMRGKKEYAGHYQEMDGYRSQIDRLIEDFRLSDIRGY